MGEQWQVDVATTKSDRKHGRVDITAYSTSFDRRRVAVVDRLEDARQIVLDHNAGRDYQRQQPDPVREALVAAEAALAAAQAEVGRLKRFAQDFWQPVVRDLEHGILSFETVRFMAQDYLAALAASDPAPVEPIFTAEMAIAVDELPEFEPTIRPAHWPAAPVERAPEGES